MQEKNLRESDLSCSVHDKDSPKKRFGGREEEQEGGQFSRRFTQTLQVEGKDYKKNDSCEETVK